MWKHYATPQEGWKAMYAACEGARISIKMEQFIFKFDGVGERFVDLLIEKARAGVLVRLLVDMAGSFDFFNDAGTHKKMRAAGIELEFFNPIRPWRLGNITSWFNRDHRKILIVDSAVAFTGSLGVKEDMSRWRESTVEVGGAIVKDMEAVFDSFWAALPRRKWIAELDHSDPNFRFIPGIPRRGQRFLYYSLLDEIGLTESSIFISTPYFIPSRRFFGAIRKAARRGVDVRLIVPKESDHMWVDFATQSFFTKALKSGIKIYRYAPDFIHAKLAVFDDRLATVGSCNFDNLSFFYNHEGNLFGADPEFVDAIKKQFLEDLGKCEQLELEKWQERLFISKWMEFLTKPFHRVM